MQIARKLIFNKLDRLFKYLHPFVFEKDVKSLEYVLKVIKIICNCADQTELRTGFLKLKEP